MSTYICSSMFGRGAAGVSSRLMASSMVVRFSGKSRTVRVLNSELDEIDAPLKPLPSCPSTLARLPGSRYLTSKTLLLKPFSVTKSLSDFCAAPEFARCATNAEIQINIRTNAARTFFVALNIRPCLLDTFGKFTWRILFCRLMREPDDAYVLVPCLHFNPQSFLCSSLIVRGD